MEHINLIAVLVSAVASVFLGAAWFSPILFGKTWMEGMGKTSEQVEKDFSPIKPLLAFVGAAIIAAGLSILIHWAQGDSVLSGILVGVLAAIIFVTTTTATHFLFEHRPLKLFMIVASYDVVGFAIISAIVTAWA